MVLCVVIVGLLGSVKHDDDWNSHTLPHLRPGTQKLHLSVGLKIEWGKYGYRHELEYF